MHHWLVVSVFLFCISRAFLLHDASFICSCCCFILQNSWAFLLHDTSLIYSWICSFSSANLELFCFMIHALISSPYKFCFANLKVFFFFPLSAPEQWGYRDIYVDGGLTAWNRLSLAVGCAGCRPEFPNSGFLSYSSTGSLLVLLPWLEEEEAPPVLLL